MKYGEPPSRFLTAAHGPCFSASRFRFAKSTIWCWFHPNCSAPFLDLVTSVRSSRVRLRFLSAQPASRPAVPDARVYESDGSLDQPVPPLRGNRPYETPQTARLK